MQTVSPPTLPGPPDATARTVAAHTVIWTPDGRRQQAEWADLPMLTALGRGGIGQCPACGKGRLFNGFLRVSAACSVCAAPLGEIRADDAPPYVTVFIVAHLAIGALLWLERDFTLGIATEMMLLLPATCLVTLVLMRPVKGAVIGAMLKLGFMKTVADAGKALPHA